MTYATNIAIDIFGMLILLLMLVNFGSKSSRKRELDDFIFTGMLLVNSALLFADMLTWALVGMPGEGARTLNFFSNTVYYVLQPFMCLFWVIYCEYKLHESTQKIRKRLIIYAIPLLVSIVMVALNSAEPILFLIDENNIYIRGPMFFPFMILCLGSFVYSSIITLHSIFTQPNRQPQHVDPRVFLLLYPVFPLIAVGAQAMFYGIAVIWTSTVISLLIIYFNLQNAQITTDPLTGLNNRRRFEHVMQSRMSARPSGSILFLLMIDIDKFKSINDRFGHAAGDNAIRDAATLLMHSVRRSDFIARIGGDEFVVIGERASREEVGETVEAIQHAQTAFSGSSAQPYSLSLSIGYSMLHDGMAKTLDEMLAEADQRMYSEKQYHHTGIDSSEKYPSTLGGIFADTQSHFD